MKSSWPALPYSEFKSTGHLLHLGLQAIGKLKLHNPFELHWANVSLWVTPRGLTTGTIFYKSGIFSIDLDIIDHQIICTTSHGGIEKFDLKPMSVADFTKKLFSMLHKLKINLKINTMAQEVPNPIAFEDDTETRDYNVPLVSAWWTILANSYRVMQHYHAKFNGTSPPVAFMWGTFDLRDVRYNGVAVPTTGVNADFIRRNAMNEAQIELGWWSGNDAYTRPAYYSFTYPQPEGIKNTKLKVKSGRWDKELSEFILDYDDLRKAENPDDDLLAFFEETYEIGSRLADWDPKLVGSGNPV